MDPFATTPARYVRPGDMMVWQYVTGIWQNDDETYTVVYKTFSGGTLMHTASADEHLLATSINCPHCGQHINPNNSEESTDG